MPFKFGTNRISTGGDITTGTPVHVDVTAVTPLITHNNIILKLLSVNIQTFYETTKIFKKF